LSPSRNTTFAQENIAACRTADLQFRTSLPALSFDVRPAALVDLHPTYLVASESATKHLRGTK
jgi:hypothetical protein